MFLILKILNLGIFGSDGAELLALFSPCMLVLRNGEFVKRKLFLFSDRRHHMVKDHFFSDDFSHDIQRLFPSVAKVRIRH